MKYQLYRNDEKLIAGITFRDQGAWEDHNMAIHACQNPLHILKNREAFAESLNFNLDDFVCANQTHSIHWHQVSGKDKGRGVKTMDSAIPDCDAMYTNEKGIVLTSFSADCVPILFWDHHNNWIGAVHSGWRGTVHEMIPNLISHLFDDYLVFSKDLHVVIGPALGMKYFEVDCNVYDQFCSLGYGSEYMTLNQKTGKYHIDNQQIVYLQCKRMGIHTDHIDVHRICTYEDQNCFSYRKDPTCGRHMSFIMMKNR